MDKLQELYDIYDIWHVAWWHTWWGKSIIGLLLTAAVMLLGTVIYKLIALYSRNVSVDLWHLLLDQLAILEKRYKDGTAMSKDTYTQLVNITKRILVLQHGELMLGKTDEEIIAWLHTLGDAAPEHKLLVLFSQAQQERFAPLCSHMVPVADYVRIVMQYVQVARQRIS